MHDVCDHPAILCGTAGEHRLQLLHGFQAVLQHAGLLAKCLPVTLEDISKLPGVV
jgi:hypothetical protein